MERVSILFEVEHIFHCQHFPAIIIEVFDNNINVITDKVPEDGVYPNYIVGVWKIKYKTIDPNRSLTTQNICPTWLKQL